MNLDTTNPLDIRIRELEHHAKSQLENAQRDVESLKRAIARLDEAAKIGAQHGIDIELKFVLAHAETLRETDKRRAAALVVLDELVTLREELAKKESQS